MQILERMDCKGFKELWELASQGDHSCGTSSKLVSIIFVVPSCHNNGREPKKETFFLKVYYALWSIECNCINIEFPDVNDDVEKKKFPRRHVCHQKIEKHKFNHEKFSICYKSIHNPIPYGKNTMVKLMRFLWLIIYH